MTFFVFKNYKKIFFIKMEKKFENFLFNGF
jgi:hypothetical protein